MVFQLTPGHSLGKINPKNLSAQLEAGRFLFSTNFKILPVYPGLFL